MIGKEGGILKNLLVLILMFVLVSISPRISAAAFIEYASAINPGNGNLYAIYYLPKDPPDFNWPLLTADKTYDISWFDAKDAAEEMGGYLATIVSQEEEAFVQAAFAGAIKGEGIRAWIGLSDAEEEGIFKWVTGPEAGQILTFADWMGGEPNNVGPEGEDYVEWRNYPYGPDGGALNDVPPNAAWINTFMVEFDGKPIPEPSTMILFSLGLIGMIGITRRKLKK